MDIQRTLQMESNTRKYAKIDYTNMRAHYECTIPAFHEQRLVTKSGYDSG